ncbi:FabD/lysophospholipase-like protein [Atractiella rhizophila]|nr:FabD/lysophospholipase-like protein [Atractiella rhizophila]
MNNLSRRICCLRHSTSYDADGEVAKPAGSFRDESNESQLQVHPSQPAYSRVTLPSVSPSNQPIPPPSTSHPESIRGRSIDPSLQIRLADIKKVNTKAGSRSSSWESRLPNLRPCQFFDLICGTSTGGWIALMLGRLGMTVRECMHAVNEIVNEVFSKKTVCTEGLSAYSDRALERVFGRIVRDYTTHSERSMLATLEDASLPMLHANFDERCRTFVIATYRANSVVPLEICSYSVPFGGGSLTECSVVEAARATSAEPTSFPPITLDKTEYVLIGNNNPSSLAVTEAQRIWGIGIEVVCFLSLGVGLRSAVKLGSTSNDIEDTFKKVVEDCSRVDKTMKNGMRMRGIGHCYHRFNIDTLSGVQWDDGGIYNPRSSYSSGGSCERVCPTTRALLQAKEGEIEVVRMAMLSGQHVAIIGLAGNGKTMVALAALHDELVKTAFIIREGDILVERRFWVRCDSFTSFAALESHLCSRVFNLSRQLDTTDLMAVADFFRSNKCLLILDNFETPAHSDSKRMQQFFQALVAEPRAGSTLVLAMRGHRAPYIDVNRTTFVQVVIGTLREDEDKDAAINTFCQFYENGRDPQNAAVTQDILSCLDYHPLSICLFALRARYDPFSSAAVLLEKSKNRASAVLSRNVDGRDGTPILEISLGFSLTSPVLQELPGSSLALSFLSWSPDGLLLLDLEGLLDGDYRPLVSILDVGLAEEVPGGKRHLPNRPIPFASRGFSAASR